MEYSSEPLSSGIFEKSFLELETQEEKIEALRHGKVFRYRTKTYRAGHIVLCEVFPLWNTSKEAGRAKKALASRPAQIELNHNNSKKKMILLINNNFTSNDIWITVGYDDNYLPFTIEEARRDIVNYIRRIKRKRKKLGLPPLKYIYVTEVTDEDGNPVRVHHHVVMSGGMDRDDIEREWRGGAYPEARRLKPKDTGLTGMAKYLAKNKRKHKLWAYSKNLKMPKPTIADQKVTKRQMEKMAIDISKAQAFFEKAFKKYAFQDTGRDLRITYSSFVSGAYIYAQMYDKTRFDRGKEKSRLPEGRRPTNH